MPTKQAGRAAAKRHRSPSDRRIAQIKAALERVRDATDVSERFARDPVSIVHRFADREDREIVAVIASCLAFGNVKALTAKIEDALGRLAPSPAKLADDPRATARALRGWKHRLYTGADLAALVVGARRVQKASGSLGADLRARFDASGGDIARATAGFAEAIRKEGGLGARRTVGARHILTSPDGGSAAKRMMLLLRWMARPADGVDLGDWDLPPSDLVIPLDVHLHRLAKNLGLTTRTSASWQAALEVTRELRRIDPDDPVKWDFPLCHLGMVQGCPSRRDATRCEGCGVKPVCIHWSRG
ncbi:MAG TPA: TIGR02757 family protein [Polyangiaceae bacterium]|nr:TIGR02757 family protein [Polyangiaceae bacterium]